MDRRRCALLHRWMPALVPVALLLASTPAEAAVSARASAPATVASATLAPPTGLSFTKACGTTSSTVTLRWTATTSAYATGYLLTYTLIGSSAGTTPQTVTGRTTVTGTYPITNGATYVVTLASSYRNWTSPNSPTAGQFGC